MKKDSTKAMGNDRPLFCCGGSKITQTNMDKRKYKQGGGRREHHISGIKKVKLQ